MSALDNVFAELAERRIPGGCNDCDAYQRMTQAAAGLWVLGVFHDAGCPAHAAREAS